jgi:hypothetical protein
MTQKEATQILAILKAAYPNSYRGMSKDEAIGTVNVWATQFIDMPVNVVMIAVNKLISTNTFPPSINEVKEKIRSLYFEAWGMLKRHKQALEGFTTREGELKRIESDILPPERVKALEEIISVTEPMRTQMKLEPSLTDLLNGYEKNYLPNGQKQLNG